MSCKKHFQNYVIAWGKASFLSIIAIYFKIINRIRLCRKTPLLKLKLLFIFYRSTLALNWSSSLAFAFVLFPKFSIILPVMLMTGGSLLSIWYKDLSRKNDYYFYYNRGLSKAQLMLFSVLMNLLSGGLLYILLNHVAHP